MSGTAESPQIETKREPDMTQTTVIPDYLKPAMERLENARSQSGVVLTLVPVAVVDPCFVLAWLSAGRVSDELLRV